MKIMKTRTKGQNFEFEVQRWMKDKGVPFERVGMSGQLVHKKGDFEWAVSEEIKGVRCFKTFRGEAKCGKQVPKVLYDWLEKDESDFLVVKRDRRERLWILTERLLSMILGGE